MTSPPEARDDFLEFTLEPDHYKAFAQAVTWRLSQAGQRTLGSIIVRVLLGAIIGLGIFGLYVLADQHCSTPGSACTFHPPSVFVGAFGMFAVMWSIGAWIHARNLRRMVDKGGSWLGENRMRLSDSRVEVFSNSVRTTVDWEAFDSIQREKTVLILWLDRSIGIVVPREAFSDDASEERFIRDFNVRLSAAKQRAAQLKVHMSP